MDTRIVKIRLGNFQRYRSQEISLGDTTVLVGPSDSGKSAWVRALCWVAYNLPRGADYTTHGEKECWATLVLSTGVEVTRKRSSGFNGYEIKKPGEEVQIFDRIGTCVPEDVVDLLELQELNVQQQHDSVFFLSLRAVDRGKLLNSLIDLRLIDSATSNARKMVASSTAGVSAYEQLVKSLSVKVAELPSLDHAEAIVDRYEAVVTQAADTSRRRLKLGETLDRLRSKSTEISELPKTVGATEGLEAIREAGRKMVERRERLAKAVYLLTGIREAKSRLRSLPKVEGVREALEGIKQQEQAAATARYRVGRLSTLLRAVEEKATAASSLSSTIESLQAKLPDRCPTCQQLLLSE